MDNPYRVCCSLPGYLRFPTCSFPGSFPLFSDLRTYLTFLRFWTLGLIRPFLPEPSSEHSLGVLWPLLTSRILRHPSRNVLSLRRRDLDARPPGTNEIFHRMQPPHLHQDNPCSLGLNPWLGTRPCPDAYHVVLVHRLAVLPPPSFRSILADDTLGLSYSSDCKACSGLSPYRFRSRWAHNQFGPSGPPVFNRAVFTLSLRIGHPSTTLLNDPDIEVA